VDCVTKCPICSKKALVPPLEFLGETPVRRASIANSYEKELSSGGIYISVPFASISAMNIRLLFVFFCLIGKSLAAPAPDDRIGWAHVIIDRLNPDGSCTAHVIHFELNPKCTLDATAPSWQLTITPFRTTRKISAQGSAFVELIAAIVTGPNGRIVRYEYSAAATDGTLREFVTARRKADPVVR
jgi:hypothetical protein